MKRVIISDKEAKKLLDPHYNRITKAIINGFADFLELTGCTVEKIGFVDYKVRTKACVIHDLIQKRIKEEFVDIEDCTTGIWNGIFALKIRDDLFIRFKKVDNEGKASNYLTKQTKKYKTQLTIDGIPDEPTLLYAGYVPDDAWTAVKSLTITCWDGDIKLWVHDLLNKVQSVQKTLYLQPQTNSPKRVFVKKDLKKKQDGTEG